MLNLMSSRENWEKTNVFVWIFPTENEWSLYGRARLATHCSHIPLQVKQQKLEVRTVARNTRSLNLQFDFALLGVSIQKRGQSSAARANKTDGTCVYICEGWGGPEAMLTGLPVIVFILSSPPSPRETTGSLLDNYRKSEVDSMFKRSSYSRWNRGAWAANVQAELFALLLMRRPDHRLRAAAHLSRV